MKAGGVRVAHASTARDSKGDFGETARALASRGALAQPGRVSERREYSVGGTSAVDARHQRAVSADGSRWVERMVVWATTYRWFGVSANDGLGE